MPATPRFGSLRASAALRSPATTSSTRGRGCLGCFEEPCCDLRLLEPAPGTKSSRVISLAGDIARSMSAISVRVAVIPGRTVIGIELPNTRRETVYLRELLAAPVLIPLRHPLELHEVQPTVAIGAATAHPPLQR